MNNILFHLRFKLWAPMFTLLIWAVIYIGCMVPLQYFLIKFGVINVFEGSLMYRAWGIVFLCLAMGMRFKEDFDFLLTLSSTRNEIFKSFFVFGIGYSVLVSLFILLEKVIVDRLNILFNFRNFTDPFHFVSAYQSDSLLLFFLFFLALSCAFWMFGLFMGALFYRFGKTFTLVFWICFSTIPFVFVPGLVTWILYERGELSNVMHVFGEFFKGFDLLTSFVYLFILTIIFSLAAYFNIRKLSQK
ncbi:hypothetical protein ACFL2O_02715 [Thermodesulfobacteriota bacterium]